MDLLKVVALSGLLLSSSAIAVEETAKPERLRDRLIEIESSYQKHGEQMAAMEGEVSSIKMRLQGVESKVIGSRGRGTDKLPVAPRKLKPYAYISY